MSDYTTVQSSSSPNLLTLDAAAQNQSQSREIALTIASAADDRKGGDIILLDVAEVSYLADYFIIVTGFSRVQVRAIAQSIKEAVELEWQRYPLRMEGQAQGSWIIQDYGDIIVHVMMPKEREFYNLEAFWGHAERINFSTANRLGA